MALASSDRTCSPTDFTNIRRFAEDREKWLVAKLSSPSRYQSIDERKDRSVLPPDFIKAHSSGRFLMSYRGSIILKSPDDLALYYQLLWYLKPATVIEIGSYSGSFGLWMADMLKLMNVECKIHSMDIDLSLLDPQVTKVQPDNLYFVEGDSHAIEKTFTHEVMSKMKHPVVVIEDAQPNIRPVLTYFHKYLRQGDYMVVEDTNPDIPAGYGMGGIYDEYEYHGTDKLNELRSFLRDHKDWYAVDSFYTDFFGYNATWNWHGFIRKMK